MKTKGLLRIAILFFCATGLAACNNDKSGFSPARIQQALLDMKGKYEGSMNVSYYHGDAIATFSDAMAMSKDSLKLRLPLLPIAELIKDKDISQRLKQIGDVAVEAGYEFLQMDFGSIHFVLHPRDAVILDENNGSLSVKIVFSQNFGGDAEIDYQSIIFNISPTELWINGEKSTDFSQLVYHFSGSYK